MSKLIIPAKSFPGTFTVENKNIEIEVNDLKAGLFCLISWNFNGLLELLKFNKSALLDYNISFKDKSTTYSKFKDNEQESFFKTLYKDINLFEITKNLDNLSLIQWVDGNGGIYNNSTVVSAKLFFDSCFLPSEEQNSLCNTFIEKYHINFDKTIGVCVRVTDKYKEVKIADPLKYLSLAKDLLVQNPGFRVLIQTDQKQVRDLFQRELGNQCFFFEELPVTETNVPIHSLNIHSSKLEFTKNINVAVNLLSRCKYLINHTGNTAYAIMMYRGNSLNVWQFDREANLQHESLQS